MSARILWSCLLATLLTGALAHAQATDFINIYQRALQNDPLLREAEANRLAAREARPQALSALLPQVTLTGQVSNTESDGVSVFFTGTGDIATTETRLDADGSGYVARLEQSIFRWENWAAWQQAGKQVAQAEAQYLAAQQNLVLRVTQRFFGVLAAQNDLEAQQSALDAISRQLEQANKRFEVGLIAITDVQEAQAAYDAGVAAVIAAKRALATSEELLREITGDSVPASALSRPGESMPLQPPQPASEERWIAAAMEQNPGLIASRLAAEIARDDIRIARGGHAPFVSLTATRTDTTSDGTRTTASGAFPADSDSVVDEIALQVTVPIYSGGRTSSRVRQTVYLHRAAKERLERIARETERSTRDAYLGVMSEISRVQALGQSLESSRTALQAIEAGYEVGTRTAVDVLDARRALAQAETTYARSRYDYLLNLIQLKLAAGNLAMADVEQINQLLQPPPPPEES
jgi:outer membrane protein